MTSDDQTWAESKFKCFLITIHSGKQMRLNSLLHMLRTQDLPECKTARPKYTTEPSNNRAYSLVRRYSTKAVQFFLDENKFSYTCDVESAPPEIIRDLTLLKKDEAALTAKIEELEIHERELSGSLKALESKISARNAAMARFDIMSLAEILATSREAVNICGVYFLLNEGRVAYVGQSVSVFSRVSTHIREKTKKFTAFSYVEVPQKKLDRVEAQYIHAFKPKYNKSAPRPMRVSI